MRMEIEHVAYAEYDRLKFGIQAKRGISAWIIVISLKLTSHVFTVLPIPSSTSVSSYNNNTTGTRFPRDRFALIVRQATVLVYHLEKSLAQLFTIHHV